ncbi:WD repeat-containing protein 6 [Coemansia sp. RSA 1722]|nr:WD repeat-containing protein 6 [Coemansia sp. RSA 486]KAJ2600994.1 WD repeat-containing protein 6 [Coemansia sp. RSA 1721]KAJ2604840.1 WD repeat-containing protein 6 [Coemansia sp. RSA 1722]KAJ2638102.1 WD repeat-containing protein 6 [Coemansia sp. RSA 1286]
MSPSLLAGASHLPVTAIEFLTQTTVLVGAGNQLSLYDIAKRSLVHRIRVFKDTPTRIYGIIVRPIGDDETQKVLVFGAKQWAVINVYQGLIAVLYQCRMVDWIKAAHWCWCPQRTRWMAVLASAHNRVFLCDPEETTGKVIAMAQCEERCILYSAAFHGHLLDNLVVASGTVFNQVLVWRPQWSESDSLVDKRLAAHDGVVFHVRFSSDGSELVSASDDRTLRIWDVQAGGAVKETLYGHRARVWTGAALQRYVVSASEDGSCRVWSRGQKDEHAILWQSKKNVWTLAIGPSEDLMVAGAADGSVFVWSLDDAAVGSRLKSTEMLKASDLPLPAEYYPVIRSRSEHIRCFFMYRQHRSVDTDEPTVIAVMDSGCVLRKQPDSEWNLLCHVPGLVGYSVLGCTLSGDLAAAGMRDGSVMLLGGSGTDPWPTLQLHTARIDLVHVAQATSKKKERVFDLITVDCDCRIVWSRVSADAVFGWRPVAELRLPGRARMASAAVNLALGWAVVGSHNGGLYFFDLPREDLSGSSGSDPLVLLPAVSWPLAHADGAITSIVLQASASNSRCATTVVTAGKDGFVQRFEISLDDRNGQAASMTACGLHARVGPAAASQSGSASIIACVRRTASERLTAGSVGGLYVIDRRLYAVTFYRNRLVLVDACSHTDVFSVAFAERDRRWQVHYEDGLCLGFINKMQALVCPVSSRSHRENYALVQGVSSLDIRAISSTSINNRSAIIALGGEDCVLRVCEITSRGTVECLARALKHSSVIRCVLFVPGTGGGTRYILTAGGSCELRCWTLFGLDQSVSLLEWAVAPPVFSNDCDSRVMDLAIVSETCDSVLVAAAYSDASIRLWRLCLVANKFVCVAHDSSRAHGRCILTLSAATVADTSEKAVTVLFSGATDGRVFIWDLTRFVHKGQCATDSDHDIREPLELGPPIAVIDGVHRSGVNTLDTVALPNKQIAVATGGDDNSLCYFTVSSSVLLEGAGSVDDCDLCRYENAHASAVQQVRFVGTHKLCSVATDQRVATWSIDHGSITMLSMECTQVADPSAMVLLDPNKENGHLELLVAGIGIEAFEIKPE